MIKISMRYKTNNIKYDDCVKIDVVINEIQNIYESTRSRLSVTINYSSIFQLKYFFCINGKVMKLFFRNMLSLWIFVFIILEKIDRKNV